jgi:hypothetical protein
MSGLVGTANGSCRIRRKPWRPPPNGLSRRATAIVAQCARAGIRPQVEFQSATGESGTDPHSCIDGLAAVAEADSTPGANAGDQRWTGLPPQAICLKDPAD